MGGAPTGAPPSQTSAASGSRGYVPRSSRYTSTHSGSSRQTPNYSATGHRRSSATSHAATSGWVWLLLMLVLVQTLLGLGLLIDPRSSEIAGSLYGMIYPNDPYAAQNFYQWYLTWSIDVGLVTAVMGAFMFLVVAALPRNPLAVALGVIYILPIVALIVGSVLVAVLMAAAFLIGVILSIAVIALSLWLIGQFLK
jgi:hypothetical protein